MKVSILLLSMLAVHVIDAGNDGLRLCEEERDRAAPGDWVPECTKSGKYKRKQCNDHYCWCVTKHSGEPKYQNQIMPVDHDYNCKKSPRPCLKEELRILTEEENQNMNKWFPACDCLGFYEQKQCVPVKCPAPVRRKRRALYEEKRDTSTSPTTCGPLIIGDELLQNRPNTDDGAVETYVSKAAFSSDGKIQKIQFNAKTSHAGNCVLKLGIFRPQGHACEFKMVWELAKNCSSLLNWLNTVDLTGNEIAVQKGDRFGFSWEGGTGGPILFDQMEDDSPPQFCYVANTTVSENQTVKLADGGAKSRKLYSIQLTGDTSCGTIIPLICSEPPITLGYSAGDPAHKSLDNAAFWTFIHNTPFEFDGEVNTFSVGVEVKGRGLRVGIYRPTGPDACNFQLVQQREWSGFLNKTAGTVVNGQGALFHVRKGDHFGFTWLHYGVIKYSNATSSNYCEKEAKYEVGDIATLNTGTLMSYREYAMNISYIPCTGLNCQECYCVEPTTGAELNGTRTHDPHMDCEED